MTRSASVPAGTRGWRIRAACQGRDAAAFFSPEGEHAVAARRREARAKAICTQCPVRSECAAEALASGEEHGVWGGFTSRERKRLLALGWADLADRTGVDIRELEYRLFNPPAEPAYDTVRPAAPPAPPRDNPNGVDGSPDRSGRPPTPTGER